MVKQVEYNTDEDDFEYTLDDDTTFIAGIVGIMKLNFALEDALTWSEDAISLKTLFPVKKPDTNFLYPRSV